MKNIILGLFVALSMVACDNDNEVAFDFRAQMTVLQQGSGETALFMPSLFVSSTTITHTLSKVDVYSVSSALHPSFKMEKYNDYYFMSKPDTVDRFQDLNSSYTIKSFSETGDVLEHTYKYTISDTLIMGEMVSSDMQYSSGKLTVKINKVNKATAYGFSICPVEKDASGKECCYPISTSYVVGKLVRMDGDDMIIGLDATFSTTLKYKICPMARNSSLIMEGPARFWDGKTLN